MCVCVCVCTHSCEYVFIACACACVPNFFFLGWGVGGRVFENKQGRTREEEGGGQNSGILSKRTF